MDNAMTALSATARVRLILTVADMFPTEKARAEELVICSRHKDCPVNKLLLSQRAKNKKVRKNGNKALVEVESACPDMEPWQLVV